MSETTTVRIQRVGKGVVGDGDQGPQEVVLEVPSIELRLGFLMRDLRSVTDALELNVWGKPIEGSNQEPLGYTMDPDDATIANVDLIKQLVRNTLHNCAGIPIDQMRLQAALNMTHSLQSGLNAINVRKSGFLAIKLTFRWMEFCTIIIGDYPMGRKNKAAADWKEWRRKIVSAGV